MFGTTGSSDLVSGLKLDLVFFLSNVLFDCTPKKGRIYNMTLIHHINNLSSVLKT